MFVVKLPKQKARNPIGAFQQRKQAMRDRRERRPADARRSWKREEWS